MRKQQINQKRWNNNDEIIFKNVNEKMTKQQNNQCFRVIEMVKDINMLFGCLHQSRQK